MAWETLEGRIRWLVEERAGGSARELARRAGLPEQHLAVFFERAAAKPTAELKLSTLTKLAAGAKVSLPWLTNNQGRPDDAFLVPAADTPDASTPDRHELEAAPREATARGRWRRYAARYATFRRAADLAQDAGVTDIVLDVAADELGEHKGEGPTEEQAHKAIERALADHRAARQRYGSPPAERLGGREATADDFRSAPAKKGAAKKGARR